MNEKEKPYITEDVRRLSDICYMIGYLSAHVDKDWADGYSADIVEYIKDLFLAKRSNHITINPCPTYPTQPSTYPTIRWENPSSTCTSECTGEDCMTKGRMTRKE